MSQPNLFDETLDMDDGPLISQEEIDALSNDDAPSRTVAETGSPTLLVVELLQAAIREMNDDDAPESRILTSYAAHILPRLMSELIGETAKGGEFMERRAAARPEKDYSQRDSWGDQSLVAHLLNGLLPTMRIIRLTRRAAPTGTLARTADDPTTAIFTAGYTLHDWNKFPGVNEILKRHGVEPENVDIVKDRPAVHEILRLWCGKLGIADFLGAYGFSDLEACLDALAWVAANTQVRYGTHLPSVGLDLEILPQRTQRLIADLSRLSDLFVSVAMHPARVDEEKLAGALFKASDGVLNFGWHQLAENRGLLANVINNAVMEAYQKADYAPLLYFPHGVAYVREASITTPVAVEEIPNRVVVKIKELCASQLKQRQIGFGRDGKGFKFADYYRLFFHPSELVAVAADAALRIINEGKSSSARNRGDKLAEFQRRGILSPDIAVAFDEDIRIDQLAEFCDVAERKIIAEAPGFTLADDFDAVGEILAALDVSHLRRSFDAIANLNEAIREAGEKGNTGGVPLHWYFVAAEYVRAKRPRPEEMRNVVDAIVKRLGERLAEAMKPEGKDDGWEDVRRYVARIVTFSGKTKRDASPDFTAELARYESAKLRRGDKMCSLCSSEATIAPQREAAILFAPQVYTNKQVLFSSQAIRHICAICTTETMLRQILMNRGKATGGDFEGNKYRYLFFYPMYFFTPETATFLECCYRRLEMTDFKTSVRDRLVNFKTGEIKLEISDFQRLDDLLMPPEMNGEKKERLFKIQFPKSTPVTFFFMALPPRRDATDTESWVMPTFLALTLPLTFDVKTVVSESPVPLHSSAADFPETVVLDAPHQTLATLVERKAFRRHHLLPALRRLVAAYSIHLDVNNTSKDYYNWGALTGVARNLQTTPLYVFDYLNAWLRKQGTLDVAPAGRRTVYFDFYLRFDPEGEAMSHVQELVRRYREFYRAKRRNAKSNAILKPIEVAVRALEETRKSGGVYASPEALTEAVVAEVSALMSRVRSRTAEGKPTLAFIDGRWRRALTPEQERQKAYEFAEYFVKELFVKEYSGDRTRLTGKQLNLLKSACEFLYRRADDEENPNLPADEPEDVEAIEDIQQ